LSRRYSDQEIAAVLRQAGVLTSPLSDYYTVSPPRRALLLGFAGFSEEDITQAARKIRSVLEKVAR